MRIFVIACLLFFSFTVKAQKVKVSGKVIDAGGNPVTISVNDTVRKAFKRKGFTLEKHESLSLNKDVYYESVESGSRFTIYANKKDSIFFYSDDYKKTVAIKDLIDLDDIQINVDVKTCVDYQSCNEIFSDLLIFIGEKINFEYINDKHCGYIKFDRQYSAKYEITKLIEGNYSKDTICFDVFHHSGKPKFPNFEKIILYVGKFCNKYIHIKYTYNQVYKSKDNIWVTPYDWLDYKRQDSIGRIEPKKIIFPKEVYYTIDNDFRKEELEKTYPHPYYKIKDNKAYPIYGYSLEDIVKIKRKQIIKRFKEYYAHNKTSK